MREADDKVFCEVCVKAVPKSEALVTEGRDYVAYFCGSECYERWRGVPAGAGEAPPQEGTLRSQQLDDRMKKHLKHHPPR